MKLTFRTPPKGTIRAIPSKSAAHRMLICACFADTPSFIQCPSTSADIDATVRCLCALGAGIVRTETGFSATPVCRESLPQNPVLDCGESGSTLRFLLPVVAALGCGAQFVRHGRLAQRPLSPLYEELIRCGVTLPDDPTAEPLVMQGKLSAGAFTLAADVSSQFISGLLMAMPLMQGDCTLTLTGKVESADYIRITTSVMKQFGAAPEICDGERMYSMSNASYCSPASAEVEGDWSNAALWLVMGAIGEYPITVTGLRPDSPQGDRRITEILASFGAGVCWEKDAVTVSPAPLHGIRIDASPIPDLVPVMAAAAAAAQGETVISGIARLRLKESDRAAAVTEMLSALGADIVCGSGLPDCGRRSNRHRRTGNR